MPTLNPNRLSRIARSAIVLSLIASPLATMVQAEKIKGVVNKQDSQGRIVYRDSRPDASMGWFVAAKSAFWPLCYEALDRLAESRNLIGKENPEALADSLEKSGAWLVLSASAAMTDGQSGIIDAGTVLDTVSHAIRDGEFTGTDEELHHLITLAQICTAKSHLLRAENIDGDSSTTLAERRPKAATLESVKEANREVQEELLIARQTQYDYQAQEIERHLNVAQVYLEQAAADGKFKLLPVLSDPIPTLGQDGLDESSMFVDQIRERMSDMLARVVVIQEEWVVKSRMEEY